MGAIQAQDYQAALWAVGVRCADGVKRSEVEKALADRSVIRTWVMRGTIHLAASRDVRWMLDLLTPRVLAAMSKRASALGLDATSFAACARAFRRALKDGAILTREQMYQVMESAGVHAGSQRGYHVLCRLAQEKVICFGPQEGARQTFVLLDDWCPPEEAYVPASPLAELAVRYFTSHGPATDKDLAWWSGLTLREVRQGLAEASGSLSRYEWEGTVYWTSPEFEDPGSRGLLLPGFDEYLLGYADRQHVLDAQYAQKIVPGSNGVFRPILVQQGRIIGTWQLAKRKRSEVVLDMFEKTAPRGFNPAIQRYADYLDETLD